MFPWFSFLTYAGITAVMPGPNNMMSMTQAGRLGIRRSFPFNLGIWTGFTVVMVLCTALESTLHAILPVIRVLMLFVGAG